MRLYTMLLVSGLHAATALAGPAQTVRIVDPGQLQYRAEPSAPGARIALVAGDPKQGPYTIRARFEPGARTPPHSHPDERVVTVLSGQYSLGTGARFDARALQSYGPGTVLVVPAGLVHFSAAGNSETLVQESGAGPTAFLPAAP